MRPPRDVARENSEWQVYLPALAQALYDALSVEIDEYQLYLDMEMEALRESIMEVSYHNPGGVRYILGFAKSCCRCLLQV